jgi:hypothetical protein
VSRVTLLNNNEVVSYQEILNKDTVFQSFKVSICEIRFDTREKERSI